MTSLDQSEMLQNPATEAQEQKWFWNVIYVGFTVAIVVLWYFGGHYGYHGERMGVCRRVQLVQCKELHPNSHTIRPK